jgi:hypothetical protein
VHEVALLQVLAPAQPGPAHAAAVEHQREAALDQLGPELERLLGHPRAQPRAIVVHRPPGRLVAVPAADPRHLLLGDAAPPGAVLQLLQALARMVALVGDQLGRVLRPRGGIDRRQVGFGRLKRLGQGRGVAAVGGVDLGGDDGAGVEVDRVLGLVGEAGAAVLELGDPGLGIARRGPVRVREPLAFALAVEPDQVLGRRRRDPARLGQTPEHLPVALAGVAPHDRAQGGVGLHGRGVDPDALPLIRPCSAKRSSTQAKTASCTSSGSRARALLSHEWSGTGSVAPSRRNSRRERLSEQRHSSPRSLSIPSK